MKCIECNLLTTTSPCSNCGSTRVFKTGPGEHEHQWSRLTLTAYKCQVCDITRKLPDGAESNVPSDEIIRQLNAGDEV